ncbi:MAG: hypothetical protein HYT42_01270 [Candidatus Sungbacteria bacterium]|nr:hypothetical protein [Candidatus Sungbacteria bacterium]
MFIILLSGFLIFLAADIYFATAAFWHLRQYTLPGWNAARIVMPLFVLISLLLIGFASYALIQIYFLP